MNIGSVTAAAVLLGTLSTVGAAEYTIDTISVESTTIDDRETVESASVSSTMTFTSEEVEEINPKTISDILNSVPGVTLSDVGTDAVKVHIRGVDNQMYMGERPGVAIVIDGVPVQETTGKINVDLDNIESVKVIKGGASYLYGNDALAGAVIITTKRAKGKDASKIEGEIGSFGSQRILATTNRSFENSALQLQGSYRDSDGWWDDAFVTIKSVNGKYTYYIDDTSDITLGLDYTKRDTGDGNSVSGTIAAETDPKSTSEYSYGGYYNSELTKGFITYSKDIGEESNVLLRVHNYKDDKKSKLARFTKDVNEIWEQNGAKGEFKTAFDSAAMMVGFDLQRNTTDDLTYAVSDGSLLSDYATEEAINALYAELKYHATQDLTATFNMRYDNIALEYVDNSDSTNNVSPSFNVLSYRAGLHYAFDKEKALYASYSTGFRTPTAGQVSNNQEMLNADPTLDVPSEIDVETTHNYELGMRGKIGIFSYDASVYQLDRKDYIGKVAGSYITSDDENESVYDNVGDMRTRGFELALHSARDQVLSFDLAYAYMDAIFTDYVISQQITADPDGPYRPLTATFQRVDLSGNRVSRTSKHNVDLTVHFRPTDSMLISTELFYKSSYYADEANAHKQGGYGVVNMRGEFKYDDALEFFARIDNLFNRNYYKFVNISSSILATMEDDATIRVAPPRAFYAGMRYRF